MHRGGSSARKGRGGRGFSLGEGWCVWGLPCHSGWVAPLQQGEGAIRHGWGDWGKGGSEKGVQKGEVRQKSLSCIAAGGRGTGKRQTWGRVVLTAGAGCSPPSSPSAGVRREGRRCRLLAPSLDSQAPSETCFPLALPRHACPYSAPLPFPPCLHPGCSALATQPRLRFPTCTGTFGGWRPGSWLLPARWAGGAGTRVAGCANRLWHVPDPPRVAAGSATTSLHPAATPASPPKTRGAPGG